MVYRKLEGFNSLTTEGKIVVVAVSVIILILIGVISLIIIIK